MKPEQLSDCEVGSRRPSIAQLKRLAGVYRRPLAVFYLPHPPKEFDPLHDFRRLPEASFDERSPQLSYEVRRAHERRDLALELYRTAAGEPPPPIRLKASMEDEPEQLGGRIRRYLGIEYEQQVRWPSLHAAFKAWRSALEERFVLVFQAPRISIAEMRGFSISDMPMPVVVLNSGDSIGGRIFTMLHELSHVVIRNGGLCDLGDNHVEVFCNRVAGAALVPGECLLREPEVEATLDRDGWSEDDLVGLANRYRVSREVVLRRLLILDRTSEAFYRAKREEWRAELRGREKKRGGPPPDVMAVNYAGPTFVRLVLDNYHQEHITASDVADFLAVKLKHLGNIEALVSGSEGGAVP